MIGGRTHILKLTIANGGTSRVRTTAIVLVKFQFGLIPSLVLLLFYILLIELVMLYLLKRFGGALSVAPSFDIAPSSTGPL